MLMKIQADVNQDILHWQQKVKPSNYFVMLVNTLLAYELCGILVQHVRVSCHISQSNSKLMYTTSAGDQVYEINLYSENFLMGIHRL